ncbi:MAG: PqqD family protein [Acidobacteriia bacterium]|nr:PqqD family protein [Terriglobia bacterium]
MSSRSLIFDSSSTVVAAPDQVSCDIGSQMAILHLKSGIYYGLDAVGTRVWELVQEPRRLGDIEHVLLSEYEVERGRLAVELRDLCQTLAKAGLIEISDATRG